VKHHGTGSKHIKEFLSWHRKEMSEIGLEMKAVGVKFDQLKQAFH
jgi:hypothetical protein